MKITLQGGPAADKEFELDDPPLLVAIPGYTLSEKWLYVIDRQTGIGTYYPKTGDDLQ